MKIKLYNDKRQLSGDLKITGSKSESNRLLILQALYPTLKVENLSNSDDTQYLKKALGSEEKVVDIHHAGTAMRFLTAYFATRQDREVVLTGSKRMQERPVKLLVDALKMLGADITYEKNQGFPPLRIKGKHLTENQVKLQANISSQYISALMLIAPSLPNGLQIDLVGQVTSQPYISMTLEMMRNAGITGEFNRNKIVIEPADKLERKIISVESDWSSASYFYSLAAISDTAHIRLGIYREKSLQGDCCISEVYRQFGVETHYEDDTIVLEKTSQKKPRHLSENLIDSPDIAQTIAVTCLALGVPCTLKGLHTLKIKETDRLAALKAEIEKFGSVVNISKDSLELIPNKGFNKNVSVATYNDHRMAMAFAPLGLKVPLEIEDAMVVSKSYPDFWKDLEMLGFSIDKA
ncbi:3-phosphoshikimate 1-carboxyvinyltransferase [Salegentibacter sp. F14]